LRVIAVEAGHTLLLEAPVMSELAARAKISIIGYSSRRDEAKA
jgi:DUF1009 family protein